VGGFLTSIELRVGVPGTGELHLIVPDAAGGGKTVDKVFPVIVSAGLNTFTLGTPAAYAVCPTLPATMYAAPGFLHRLQAHHRQRPALHGGRQAARAAIRWWATAGVGSAVTFSPASTPTSRSS
jgi:hypothetical protein